MSVNTNIRASDLATVVAKIDPDSAVGTITSAWVDASRFHALLAIVQVGDLGASATVDAKLQQATDSAGAGAKDVPGTAITQITAGDDIALINVDHGRLDLANNYRYVRLQIVVGTAASEFSGLVLGFGARYGPAAHVSGTEVK